MSPSSAGAARGTAMREIDPLDLVETIREALLVLEPDLTIALREPLLLPNIRSRAGGHDRPQAL